MPPKQKMLVKPGDSFGKLTVLSENGRNKHGHLQYLVRCECGTEYTVARGYLFDEYPRCRNCAEASGYREKMRKYHLWDVVNHWILLTEPSPDENDKLKCLAMCLSCGNVSVVYPAEIKARKGYQCAKCPSEYYFTIKDGVAYGVLPSGERFLIDEEDVDCVSLYYWHMAKDGYVISTSSHRKKLRLHNFIMRFEPQKKVFIDHINRNPLDCRKCNLRLVTAQQNSMNKSIQKNSTTGYAGVTFSKRSNKYRVRIGLNNKRIELGENRDPVVCAQMYNYASILLFGEFAGHKNDVPDPPEWIKQRVEEKCKPYMLEAMIATQPCGITIAQTKGV